ncbi:hypothetical protein [Limisalsivibrio acetivorans]|uniref:hypothetical protein n=1 Tax=Limisalsivibrio acetivorans TaxID=1304888 RepID=UPI0003B5F5F1|nr:hypothetical protein [Limisalsivibrio acetivorans]
MARLFVFLVTLLIFSGSAFAESGRDIYATKCGGCGKKPADKVSIQWNRWVEKKKYEKCCEGVTPDEVDALKNYLVSHAADSDQPEGDTFN